MARPCRRWQLRTDEEGDGLVRFNLPADISQGDGLLTVMADDGGITESIAKRVPIVVKKLQLSLYPEGGELVSGLPGRVYFEAKNPIGKPADIAGGCSMRTTRRWRRSRASAMAWAGWTLRRSRVIAIPGGR
jgi:hypothetical protein